MEELSRLCFVLDYFHEKLFQLHEDLLRLTPPLCGFLSQDCFHPSGEEECYPIIAGTLEAIFTIIESLKEHNPSLVHSYLRKLHADVAYVKRLKCSSSLDRNTKEYYDKMMVAVNKISAFLGGYAYKLEVNYQANNALLLMTMLFDSAKLAYQQNVKVDRAVIQDLKTKKTLTLADVAKNICETTGLDARSLQFISIGASENGELWVTTNYHSPVVYPLAVLLNKSLYKEAEDYRGKYKVDHRSKGGRALIFSPHIHAETMMAGLKSLLKINHILIVDASGNKVENCPCCSHYLCIQGFGSEPHMESIQNYETPTRDQLSAIHDWTVAVKAKFPESLYSLNSGEVIPGEIVSKAVAEGKKLLEAMFGLLPHDLQFSPRSCLEQIFYVIKAHYPFVLENSTGLKETYHLANKLSSPEKEGVNRTVIRSTVTSKRHPNKSLRLFDDNRLELAKNGRSLQPKDPGSPRSQHIARYANEWLRKGDPSIFFRTEEDKPVILLKR
ncbi:MAG: hypothetical protein SFW07_00830 [Gammaproteobacteria bacterium]|nr:hypothetical protein [Gammaproteobacteria bacterium]